MDGTLTHPSFSEEKWNFIFPWTSDYSVDDKTGIIVNLPPPKKVVEISRFMEYFSFYVNILEYNVR